MKKNKESEIMVNEAHEQYIVNEKGEKIAVVLPIEEYEKIIEDLHDLAVIAERKDEPTISFEDLKEHLKKDGLL